jgi:CubicO group peptidase (beta-lactamase class C family)
VQSVPGGSHWGGGMSVSASDQLKVAQMLLDGGVANGRRVLSAQWIARMQTPCALAPYYGYLVWLNTGRRVFPGVPETSYFGVGAGSSFMWIEPERRIALIVRWLDSQFADAFFGKMLEAIDTVCTR